MNSHQRRKARRARNRAHPWFAVITGGGVWSTSLPAINGVDARVDPHDHTRVLIRADGRFAADHVRRVLAEIEQELQAAQGPKA